MRKRLKFFSVFSVVLLAMSFLLYKIYFNSDGYFKSVVVTGMKNELTLSEIEDITFDYFKDNNLNLKMGSKELSLYFKNQLMFDFDKKLVSHKRYDEILAYFAEYLHENSKNYNQSSRGEFSMKPYGYKKISDIRAEILAQEANLRSIQYEGSYNANNAVEYVNKWCMQYNEAYNNYGGNDCTNFISQVVNAGGMDFNKPNITKTTPNLLDNPNYWYSILINENNQRSIKDSVTWVNVSSFNKYWSQRVKNEKFNDRLDVQRFANVGDVIQYKYKNTGRLYHSTFVSKKIDDFVYISQHSSDRLDIRWMDYEVKNSDFILFKFSQV